jgi:CBS domain-containing protein
VNVREVMTNPVISLRPHTTVDKAAELLVSHGFGAVPVRTAEGGVLGIATEADLVRDRVDPSAGEGDLCAEHMVSAVMTPAPVRAPRRRRRSGGPADAAHR